MLFGLSRFPEVQGLDKIFEADPEGGIPQGRPEAEASGYLEAKTKADPLRG
jgi:hypothetical protein